MIIPMQIDKLSKGLKILIIGSLIGTSILYANNPVGVRLSVANKLFHSLPKETQTAVVGELFLEQEYQDQVDMVLYYIENSILMQEDYAYIGGSALLKVDPYTRAAALEVILEESPYEIQKYIVFDGMDNLTPEDCAALIAKSGGKIFSYLSKKIVGLYEFLVNE